MNRVRVRASKTRVSQQPEIAVKKSIIISKKIESEKEEISEDYKKIIFYTVEVMSNLSDISKITAIKMGFNLKTGEFIRLEEFQDTNKETFKIFSNDVKHFVSHNVKLNESTLDLNQKIQFCTMLTNVNIVEIKKSNGRNRWPKLLEVSKYYGVKSNEDLVSNNLNITKLTIQVFQKMLKHPKGSICVRDFIFNDVSYKTEL
ncbi:hypothetical protein [Cetobacterium sp.]|uniref:hypothetical protein n=1 Tax=Cetobacterium sp. TaxID=2071632 RepID=UPI003F38F977